MVIVTVNLYKYIYIYFEECEICRCFRYYGLKHGAGS